MKFEMNNRIFTIKKETEDNIFSKNKKINDGLANYFGLFLPYEQEILLSQDLTKEQARKTLMHELSHCYIWCYMGDLETLSEENICNIVANSHDIIHNIVDKYFK